MYMLALKISLTLAFDLQCLKFSWPPSYASLQAENSHQQSAPSAADACPAVAALDIHLEPAAVVGDMLDTAVLAGGLQSCTDLDRSCEVCHSAAWLVASVVRRCGTLLATRQQTHRRRRLSRLVLERSSMPVYRVRDRLR